MVTPVSGFVLLSLYAGLIAESVSSLVAVAESYTLRVRIGIACKSRTCL